MGEALSDHDLGLIDRYWAAANYLTIGQIYLQDNPLLREPPDPFRSPEAQAYLNSWDGTERFMTITVLVPTKG